MKSILNKPQVDVQQNEQQPEIYKGYYLFQMYIHSVSELHLEKLINGIFTIEVGENKLYSSVIKELGTGEKILIQQSFQTQVFVDHESDFDNTLIQIQLSDHSRFLSDKQIFSLCFSLKSVYIKENQQEINVWNVFLDYSKNDPFMGYINYSVSCQKTHEVPRNLMTLHMTETESNFKIPKNLKTKTKTLEIKIFTGELYQKSDLIGLADPYLKFTIGNSHRKTVIKNNTLTPEFNQILYFKLMFPFALENLRIQLIDHDSFNEDDLLSTLQIKLKHIVKGKYSDLRYLYFYGGDEDGYFKDNLFQINQGYGIPSKLKGKILASMQILNEKQEEEIEYNYHQLSNIQQVFQTIDENDHKKINWLQQKKYYIQMYIESFQNVYVEGKFQVLLKWGEKCSEIKDFKITYIFNRADIILNIDQTFLINTKFKNDTKQIPDVYFYLQRDKKTVKFLKLSYKHITKLNRSQTLNFILQDDYSNCSFYHQFPGIITFKIITSKNPLQNLIQRPERTQKDVYIYTQLYQGKDLAGLDDSGLSDPQVFITYQGVQKQSSIQQQTINPLWNECFEIELKQVNDDKGCLIVEVFDIDKKLFDVNAKEFIGSFVINLNENKQDLNKPTWYQLQQGELYLGQILMSFQFSYTKLNNSALKQIKQTEYVICSEILGLRNLQQNAIFQIKSPEIWLQNFQKETFLKLKTEENGSNINFCQTVKIDCNLPEKIENFPNYSIIIRKNNFSFFESEKLVGTVTVDLNNTYIKSSQYMINYLQKFSSHKNKKLKVQINKLYEKLKNFDEQEELQYETMTKFKQNIQQINQDLIVYPKFQTKEINGVEVQIIEKEPDLEQYIKIGYNSKEKNTLHYRKFFDFELEQFLFIKNYLYEDYQILKGRQKLPQKFYDQFENFQKQKVQGNLRSRFFVLKKEIYDDIQNLQRDFNFQIENLTMENQQRKMKKQKYNVKIYILEASFYGQHDSVSSQESYYKIEIQENKIEGKKVQAEGAPKFYSTEQISFTTPGDQQLKISFYKSNYILKDYLVGQTTIELEQRILNTQFNQLDDWLIESRQLKKPESKTAEGIVMLGIDIHSEDQNTKTWDISLQPPTELELRLIIWNLHTITHNSLFSGTDLFVKATFPGEINFSTDTHNRSTGGQANFNYRMVAPLMINEYTKVSNLNINLKIFDADYLSNEYIAEAKLEIGEFIQKVIQTKKSYQMKQKKAAKGMTKFKIKCQDKVQFDEEGNVTNNDVSEILISLECLTKKDADLRKVGQGREAPNQFPYLPEPKREYLGFSIKDTLKEQFGPNVIRNLIILSVFGVLFFFGLVFVITFLAVIAAK